MKIVLATIACLAVMVGSVEIVDAQTFQLAATVRDFKKRNTDGGHPDFQWSVSGHVPGLTSTTLDSDHKPVFVASPGSGAITSATTFAQWFRDVPGVNMRKDILLPMTNSGAGVYTFADSSFFPIDNELFGNQGHAHNYHFTMEVAGEFYYDSANANSIKFTGDDDIWVYINSQRVVDLGGVHGALSKTVDVNAIAASIGLISGNNYDIRIFWAERYLTQSNVRIDTTFEVVPEPASVAALGVILIGVAARCRRAR